MKKEFKVTLSEKKKYVLAKDADFDILAKCKQLEKLRLTKGEGLLVKLIKTQLEDDWRKPLIRKLNIKSMYVKAVTRLLHNQAQNKKVQ